MQDPYLQPGTSDRDDYFDLPDAGEDESDEGDYCRRCGAILTECDEDFEGCTQCGGGVVAMIRTPIKPPNKQWYYDRCDALARALKNKEVMPPFLIVQMCQLLMVRAIGSPWRVVWVLFLDRLNHEWDRLKDNCWWSWHQYVRLRTHAECMEIYEVWLEKKTGYDCREWPEIVEVEEIN